MWLFKGTPNDARGSLEDLNKVIALDPNFAEAYFIRANILNNTGKKKDAINDLKKALSIRKDYDDAKKMLDFLTQSN